LGANLQTRRWPQVRRRRWTSRRMSGNASRSRASILTSFQVSSDDWHSSQATNAAIQFSLLYQYMFV
ncbi:hypothetical protein BAE44_0019301, partial [Dichanthelium oligosanthes]